MANNVLALQSEWKDVDFIKLKQYIAEDNLKAMRTEAKSVAKSILAMRKQEQALSDLIPDVHQWHKQFSLEQLQEVHKNVERTMSSKKAIAGWRDRLTDKQSLEAAGNALKFEANWMSSKGKKYPTWVVAKSAYEKELSLVEHRIKMLDIKNDISEATAIIEGSRSAVGKKMVADFAAQFADNSADINILKAKAAEIKARAVAIKKSRKAATSINTDDEFVPKSDKETRKDFVAFMKKNGISVNEKDVVVQNGFVHLQGSQHKEIYNALKPETAEEHYILWRRAANGQTRHGDRAGYVQTGNSYEINTDFRETGVTGKLDSKSIAKLKARGATDDDIKVMNLLDKKIEEFSLPVPLVLTRYVEEGALKSIYGIDVRRLPLEDIKEALSNLIGTLANPDPAFMSCSTNELKNVFKGYPIKLHIEVPPNTPMYFTDNEPESEVVLGRGSKYRLKGVSLEMVNGNRHVSLNCRLIK